MEKINKENKEDEAQKHEMKILSTSIRKIPQWSLKIQVDNSMVKAGEEKKIAVASPRGNSATACN